MIEKMSNNIVDVICKASLLENSLNVKSKKRKKLNGKELGVAEQPLSFPSTSYHIIDLRSEPVDVATFQSFDPNVRATFGKFMITFLNKNDNRVRKGRRFVIDQDLIRARIFFYDYRELKKVAERVPEVAWILQNSTLTEELLDVAIRHVGVPFIFTIDWVRYDKMIAEKAEAKGIDLDLKPFVTSRHSEKIYKEKFEGKILSERRNINDYTKDIGNLYNENPEE